MEPWPFRTAHWAYYSCTGKLPALFSHREQKCRSRLSPAERLDELVWADLCALLTHPEQVTQALARAHGGHWLPQELQGHQQGCGVARRAWDSRSSA
ncbi:MAG: hypothetical protein JOY66_13845 [Acetobacteraceae bacterium]|nr:hypothetical protein [Acetobacteraceae bacterium]